jgi:4-amino-4-deoxy-L-arabinose transferase-like glycosyltransferase
LHTLTSFFIFLAARALYDDRIGFWSALVFATLPAASFSSLLISTDVPLLACWTLALYGWIKLVETKRFEYAVLIGVSLGFGLLAKYAAAYFLFCIAIDAISDRHARRTLLGMRTTASQPSSTPPAMPAGRACQFISVAASNFSARNSPCSGRSCSRC